MIPEFDSSGRLPPGIYPASWNEVLARFGFTPKRKAMLRRLRAALGLLRRANCKAAYIDGSFVTRKPEPGDYDVCWDAKSVRFEKLDSIFLDFSYNRRQQKRRFAGEFFPADLPEGLSGKLYLNFFQLDKETGEPKGIIAIDLKRWKP